MWFLVWHEEFGEFSSDYSQRSENLSSIWSKVYEVWVKKYRGVIISDNEQWCNIWINLNPDLVVSKMTWGIRWTLIRVLKSLKNCTLMGSFSPKHIIFQLENFREFLMSHDTESWCKIYRKTDPWKMTKGIWLIFMQEVECNAWKFVLWWTAFVKKHIKF